MFAWELSIYVIWSKHNNIKFQYSWHVWTSPVQVSRLWLLYVAFVLTWYLAFKTSGCTAKAVWPVISGNCRLDFFHLPDPISDWNLNFTRFSSKMLVNLWIHSNEHIHLCWFFKNWMNFGARNWVPIAFKLILLETFGIVTFDRYFIKFIFMFRY